MNSIYNAFVVIHIRVHDAKIGKYRVDVILTLIFIFLLLLSLWRLLSILGIDFIEQDLHFSTYLFKVIRGFIVLILVTLISFFWLISWPKSYKAINNAGKGGNGDGMQDGTFKQDRMQDSAMKKNDKESRKQEAKKYESPFNSTNDYYKRIDNSLDKFTNNDGSYMTFDKEIQEKREEVRKKMLKDKHRQE